MIRDRNVQNVLGTNGIGQNSSDFEILKVTFRNWRCKMVNLLKALELDFESLQLGIARQIKWLGNIVINEFKIRILQKMLDVSDGTRGKIIHADHVMIAHKRIAQMRTDKTGSACDKNILFVDNRTFAGHGGMIPRFSCFAPYEM